MIGIAPPRLANRQFYHPVKCMHYFVKSAGSSIFTVNRLWRPNSDGCPCPYVITWHASDRVWYVSIYYDRLFYLKICYFTLLLVLNFVIIRASSFVLNDNVEHDIVVAVFYLFHLYFFLFGWFRKFFFIIIQRVRNDKNILYVGTPIKCEPSFL